MKKELLNILFKKKITLAVAESCTGGLLSSALTDISGSSKYFILGVCAYANKTKIKFAGVKPATIKKHGAVSQEVAMELAEGIRKKAAAKIGIGLTGIAGPTGATPLKPVGTVFIAVNLKDKTYFKKFLFRGCRSAIKQAAKEAALDLLLECLT